jgi:hypothetical protein
MRCLMIYTSKQIRFGRSMRRTKWTGHVAQMERGMVHTFFRLENLSGKEHVEDQDMDGRKILSWIFRKRDGAKTGLI